MQALNKHSYISNFSLMKRFIKTTILFFLPFFFALAILECGMRNVPNDYKYKNNWLDKNISHIHIWTFGSSHGLYGISPKHFTKQAFNSAHVSQSLKYDTFIFDKYIERADSLEWVILPISYFTMISCMEKGEEWWRIKNYCLYYDCPYHKYELKYNCEIIGNPLTFYKQIKRVGIYRIKGVDDCRCDSLGLDLGYSKKCRASEQWWEDGQQRAKFHTKNLDEKEDIIRENQNYLKRIIEKCANKGVKVLLLTTPVCSTYYNCVDSSQYALMTETCQDFESKYNNVQYLNLFKDTRFNEDDFHDSDHLATEGAEKLTKILDEYISSISSK